MREVIANNDEKLSYESMNGLLGNAGSTILQDYVDQHKSKGSVLMLKALKKFFLKKVSNIRANGINHTFQPDESYEKSAEEFG